MPDAATFMKAMKKKGTRIDHHLSSLHSKQVEENDLKIRSIVETIIFRELLSGVTVMIDLQLKKIQVGIMIIFGFAPISCTIWR